ncbi:MAG: FAD-binding oxidoreductase [Haloarculaceae archaeon]
MARDCTFLADLLPADQIAFDDTARGDHAADWGAAETGEGVVPDAVVYPESTGDVSTVLAAATQRGVPVTPYAAGTGIEGNAVPAHAGISMDLTRLDAVLDVRPEDFQIDVEPGVMGPAIEGPVDAHGLFFPPLPSSGDISTVGGMIANDASGMQTVRYGEIADWLLELEAVLADGSVITAGSRAVKTSSGYNLKDVIVGSEGTLAVVTRATLELAGRPEQIRGARAIFPTIEAAASAVFDAVTSGVDVAKIELVDDTSARMVNDYLDTGLPDVPMVFLEFHANHGVEEEIAFCRSLFEDHDVRRFETREAAAMEELWDAREQLAFAIRAYDPKLDALKPGDVTVPISEYPRIVAFVDDLASEHDLLIPCFGHAGDGNLHYAILVDPTDADELETGRSVHDAIVERALEVGGTATGEHGIGQGKRKYLVAEHGETAVETMRRIKRALDPTDTLNPGKIFPETADGERVRGTVPGPPAED